MRESKGSLPGDDRVWYDQFTSTDWVQDSIADAHRVKELRSRTDIRGRVLAFFDGTQGWILSALVGFLTATIAYVVDVSEAPVFDWKEGYCSTGFFVSEKVSLDRAFPFIANIQGFMVSSLSYEFFRQDFVFNKSKKIP
jgi:chloride channel 3/4/5